MTDNALDTPGERSLTELESVIERGLGTFVEVGTALLEIRTRRLYHTDEGGEFSAFEDYCQDRWGFGRDNADQMIRAASVVRSLPAIAGTPLPKNEAQARELARVDPALRVEVWQNAVETHGAKVTASDVRNTARRINVRYQEPESDPLGIMEAAYVVSDDAGEAKKALERRKEVTRGYIDGAVKLWASLGYDQDLVAENWEPSVNTISGTPPLRHLTTSQGVRQLAARLERLAKEIDKRGGSLQ